MHQSLGRALGKQTGLRKSAVDANGVNRMGTRNIQQSVAALFFLIIAVSPAAGAAPVRPAAEIIRAKMQMLQSAGTLTIRSVKIAATSAMPVFYENRNYRRAWTNPQTVAQLIAAVEGISADGLDPSDYHYPRLKEIQLRFETAPSATPRTLAEADILLSDSLLRLVYHLTFGKVDPQGLSPYLNLLRVIDHPDPLGQIERAVDSGSLDHFLDSLKPKHPFYLRLKTALSAYRSIRHSGGWQPIPTDALLSIGVRDERVLQLRRRLRLTGDLRDDKLSSDLFDEHLEGALIRFQIRHYLEPDGIANRITLQVLNEPVQQRIDQIRANLERARWVLHGVPRTYLIVDIAGYVIHFVRNDRITWSARVQVGQPFRQTPVFKSEIRRLVLCPTWTVPPGIFQRDILPQVKKDPSALKRLGIKIYTVDNRTVDAETIDWSRYPKDRFPYILRQNPGPNNPLGNIKFVLPNPYFIYLHDTPEQQEFDSPWRALSAGCIRVEYPLELAELLVGDSDRWSIERLRRQIRQKRTTNIDLPLPPTILLLYMTVWVDEKQVIYFREDVYHRDAKILEGLAGEVRIRPRSQTVNPLL